MRLFGLRWGLVFGVLTFSPVRTLFSPTPNPSYYRPLDSLADSVAMSGNCANAGSGFGKNEMYRELAAPSVPTLLSPTRVQHPRALTQPNPNPQRRGINTACFDQSVTYGLAVTGLNVSGTLPLALTTDGAVSEPNVRMGAPPANLHGDVWVSGLTAGASYAIYRYNATALLPFGPPFENTAFEVRTPFVASGATFHFADPKTFLSNTAVYYIAAPAS